MQTKEKSISKIIAESNKTTEFETLYGRLNPAQKEAVDTIEGPVMVVAGPGTGKTSILTLRIANIIKKTDASPENILALTFTESGVFAMRKKLVSIIGTAGYKVNINTFHGFCNDVIKQYPEKFPRIIGSTPITDIDQIEIMEKIIEGKPERKIGRNSEVINDEKLDSKINGKSGKNNDENSDIVELKLLRPYGDLYFYVKPALSEITNLKRENISVDDFAVTIKKQEESFENIPEKVHVKGAHKGKMKGEYIKIKEKIEKNKELHKLFETYEKALVKKKFYDFADMIVEVVRTLKNDNDLLLILQESYQYVLADEHQDANNSQNEILELLANFHDNPNLFIVGDEKQAIYKFQGASLENFFRFKKLYPSAKLINLEDNYRSTQNILDASHSLIINNHVPEGHKRVLLMAKSEMSKEPIHIVECSSNESENTFIVNDIKKKIGINISQDRNQSVDQDVGQKKQSLVPAEEIAILYRDNKDAFPIALALERAGIPYKVESDNDILKDENIRKLLIIFESINNLTDDEKLGKALFIDFFKLPVIDIYKSFDNARKDKVRLIDIIERDFSEVSRKFSSWASYSHNKSFIELFEIVVKESGYLEYALSSKNSLDMMATLEAFFGEIKKMAGARKEYFLKNFIEHLERVREHGVLTKSGKGIVKEGVRLMTAHKSKGLEFDFVYIIRANDGHWGNKTRRNLFQTNVLASNLLLSDSNESESLPSSTDNSMDDERRLFYVAITRARKAVYITHSKQDDGGREQLPAQFLSEIADEYKKNELAENISGSGTFTNNSVTHENHQIKDKEYLQKLFLEQGLSVTSLNNYLKCPWEYFFVNLIRLPKAQSKHQMYGTAIHNTLETFFNKYKQEEDLSEQGFLEVFEFNLNKSLLSPIDYKDTLEKGRTALKAYFEAYKGLWNRNLFTEYNVSGVHLNVGSFDLLLKGKLDKVEFMNERDVNVIDYKTGKKKSDNKENYHRQLIFYKLLLSLDDKKKYNMISGELDFIEPDAKGKFTKEKFEVTDEEVDGLKKLLIEKGNEIYSLNFWDKNCDDKDCEYCKLSLSLRK